MKCLTTVRTGLTVLSLIVLLPALAVADAAGHALPPPTHPHPAVTVPLTPQPNQPPAERCKKLEIISSVWWYATDEAGEVNTDEAVDSYPSGTIALAYGFYYKCVPPRTLLSELFYYLDYSDEPVYSEDVLLPADPKRGGYHWRLTLEDNEPFPDGTYRVEFYDDEEQLLVSGEITVGEGGEDNDGNKGIGEKTIVAQPGRSSAEATAEPEEPEEPQETEEPEEPQETEEPEEPQETEEPEEPATPTPRPTRRPTQPPTETPEPEPTATREPTQTPVPRRTPAPDNKVQIDGTVLDGATGRPIGGAVFVVLHPGITSSQWANYGYPPSDVLSSHKTDRNGKFRHPGLEVGVEYSVIVWAVSYSAWWDDGFRLTEDDPDPYPLTITLYR